jgi:hypothetical protein
MTTDAESLDANVDHGRLTGYFVRIDVDLPVLYPQPKPGCAASGYLALTPDEADTFAHRLADIATKTRNASQPPEHRSGK